MVLHISSRLIHNLPFLPPPLIPGLLRRPLRLPLLRQIHRLRPQFPFPHRSIPRPRRLLRPLSSILFSSFSFLQTLDISSNNFFGTIPSPPPRLGTLSLSCNSLRPNHLLPLPLRTTLPRQRFLHRFIPPSQNPQFKTPLVPIQSNHRFTSFFPDLTRLPNFNFLDAIDNSISDTLSSSLPPSLVELVARNNQIEGQFPAFAVAARFLRFIRFFYSISVNRISFFKENN